MASSKAAVEVLASTHDSVLEVTKRGTVTRALGGRRVAGSAHPWIGRSLEALAQREDRRAVRAALHRAGRGLAATIVFRPSQEDSESRALRLTLAPWPRKRSEPWLIGAVLEVPDRRRAERRVERVSKSLARVQQIAHIGSWHWDVGTGMVSWSVELHRIYGLQTGEHEVPLSGFLERVHPDDRHGVQARLERAARTGESAVFEQRIVRPDGSIRVLESRVEALRRADGTVQGLEGTSRDVTDARAQEAARSEAESRLRQLVESVQAILWRADGGAVAFTFVSREAEALLGYPLDRWLSEPGFWGDHVHPEDREWVTSFRTRATDEKRHHELEYRMIGADGRVVWLRDVARVVVRDGEARELVGVMIDITESRMALDELRRSREQLRDFSTHLEWAREQERAAAAREVHDELGQALLGIKMDLGWLMRRLTRDRSAPPRTGLVDRIERMSQLADDTIESVRRICRALRPGVLDDLGLAAAIEWQARDFEVRAGVRCEVRSELGDDRLDRDLATEMFRIFQEALTNVGRHAEAKRVEVELAAHAGRLVLAVRDDGKGIAPEGPGRAHSMGLLGMRERVHRLGGSLTLSGSPGEGTELLVSVPIRASAGSLGAS